MLTRLDTTEMSANVSTAHRWASREEIHVLHRDIFRETEG